MIARLNHFSAAFPSPPITEQSEPMSPSESSRDQTELERALRSTKPWFAENGTTLIYALAAVLAVAAVVVFMQRKSSGDVQASKALLLATGPEDYREIADSQDFSQTAIADWARLHQGDRLLNNAIGKMFTDREVAIEELEQAMAAYQQLTGRDVDDAKVRERALIGLARVAETQCDGQPQTTNAAVAAWQRVLDENMAVDGESSISIFRKHAAERVAQLQSDESKSFYAWFQKLNPKPADPGLAPGQPAVPEMPSLHNLTIPESAGTTGGEPGNAEAPIPAEAEAQGVTAEKPEPEDSTEATKAKADGNGKPNTSTSKEEAKRADVPAADSEAADDDSVESEKAAAPAEDDKPADKGGAGDK